MHLGVCIRCRKADMLDAGDMCLSCKMELNKKRRRGNKVKEKKGGEKWVGSQRGSVLSVIRLWCGLRRNILSALNASGNMSTNLLEQ